MSFHHLSVEIYIHICMYVQRVYKVSKKTDDTFIPLEHLSLHVVCCGIRVVARSFVFCKVFSWIIVCVLFYFSFVHCNVCYFSIYDFYPIGVFKLFTLVFKLFVRREWDRLDGVCIVFAWILWNKMKGHCTLKFILGNVIFYHSLMVVFRALAVAMRYFLWYDKSMIWQVTNINDITASACTLSNLLKYLCLYYERIINI